MKTLMLATALAASAAIGHGLPAQVRIQTAPRAFSFVTGDPDRPMIGVSTRSSGKRDTLGLLVESVTRGGPAEKAGIEEGDRLVSVNGVNLRLSPADAGEEDMEGVTQRRLVRELAKQKAGDEVELRLYRDGNTRTVKVKTVAAEDLNSAATTSMSEWRSLSENRAVLGLSLGGSGSRRDTLGVLVVGVAEDGPAAKAGIDEGDRVAAINGVDLTVAREDAGDWQASNARIRRLNREMDNVKAGDAVELRVYSNGQMKTVKVDAAKAADVKGDAMFFMDGLSGALERLKTLQVRPPAAIRMRPRISAEFPELELRALPKVQFNADVPSALDAWRLRVAPKLKLLEELKADRPAIKAKVVRLKSTISM